MPFWGIVVHTHVPWPGTPLPPLPQLRRPFHSCSVGWCTAAVGQRSAAQGGPQPAGHPHPPGRVSAKPQHVLRRVPALTPPLSWLMHPLFWIGVAGDMPMDWKSMTKVLQTVLQKVLGGVRAPGIGLNRSMLAPNNTRHIILASGQWHTNVSQNLASNPDTTSFIACSFELSFACA